MNKLEDKTEKVVEGEVFQEQVKQLLFKNVSAACDHVLAFGIKDFDLRSGKTQTGENVVQITYRRVEQ